MVRGDRMNQIDQEIDRWQWERDAGIGSINHRSRTLIERFLKSLHRIRSASTSQLDLFPQDHDQTLIGGTQMKFVTYNQLSR